jgi:hypothetical protein
MTNSKSMTGKNGGRKLAASHGRARQKSGGEPQKEESHGQEENLRRASPHRHLLQTMRGLKRFASRDSYHWPTREQWSCCTITRWRFGLMPCVDVENHHAAAARRATTYEQSDPALW